MADIQKYLDFQKLYETFDSENGEELPQRHKDYLEEYLESCWKVLSNQNTIDDLSELFKSNDDNSAKFPFNYEDLLIEEFGEEEVLDYDLENVFGDCSTMLFYARQIEIAELFDDNLLTKKIKRFNFAINEDEEVVSYNVAFIPQ